MSSPISCAIPAATSWCWGPEAGWGRIWELVLAALAGERAVVLDADALTSFADEPQALFAAIAKPIKRPRCFTPHEGEFNRLFNAMDRQSYLEARTSPQGRRRLRRDRSAQGAGHRRRGARRAGGDRRTMPRPGWRPPARATCLRALPRAFLAQGMPGFEAAAAAVWLHGEAGNEAGPGLIAEDLPEVMPRVYRRLFARPTAHA